MSVLDWLLGSTGEHWGGEEREAKFARPRAQSEVKSCRQPDCPALPGVWRFARVNGRSREGGRGEAGREGGREGRSFYTVKGPHRQNQQGKLWGLAWGWRSLEHVVCWSLELECTAHSARAARGPLPLVLHGMRPNAANRHFVMLCRAMSVKLAGLCFELVTRIAAARVDLAVL